MQDIHRAQELTADARCSRRYANFTRSKWIYAHEKSGAGYRLFG